MNPLDAYVLDVYWRAQKKTEYYNLLETVAELKCRVESMEKSVKDTNKKITMIRNQIRKEKGREEL